MKAVQILLIICYSFYAHTCLCQADNHSRVKYINKSIPVNGDNVPKNKHQYYFPTKIFVDATNSLGAARFLNRWYSKHLYTMKEPLLFNKETNKETYRFTWLRTFHEPVVIRIEKDGNAYQVFWKETNGAGGYEPGKLTVNQSRKIEKKDWDMFIGLLDSVNYWNMKTNFTDTGNDGAIWIMEASTPDQYFVVNRWSPDENDKFYKACNFLIELTGLEINKKY